jgi:Holliday junction resolvase RusA-like endonuclease
MVGKPNMVVKFVVFGEPASKANSRKLVMFGKRPASIKSRKALAYVETFLKQCPQLRELLSGDLAVDIHVWYASRRPDLDVSLILDSMQGRIYANDRAVKEQHLYWGLDKAAPRAEITVGPRRTTMAGDDPQRVDGSALAKPARRRRGFPHQ